MWKKKYYNYAKKCIKNFPSKNEMPLPIINLDYPNQVGTKDYELNYYPFVNLDNKQDV